MHSTKKEKQNNIKMKEIIKKGTLRLESTESIEFN